MTTEENFTKILKKYEKELAIRCYSDMKDTKDGGYDIKSIKRVEDNFELDIERIQKKINILKDPNELQIQISKYENDMKELENKKYALKYLSQLEGFLNLIKDLYMDD